MISLIMKIMIRFLLNLMEEGLSVVNAAPASAVSGDSEKLTVILSLLEFITDANAVIRVSMLI